MYRYSLYQTCLHAVSVVYRDYNPISCLTLGTGAGKTHIACMLINHMKINGSLPDDKKIMFLAPTGNTSICIRPNIVDYYMTLCVDFSISKRCLDVRKFICLNKLYFNICKHVSYIEINCYFHLIPHSISVKTDFRYIFFFIETDFLVFSVHLRGKR